MTCKRDGDDVENAQAQGAIHDDSCDETDAVQVIAQLKMVNDDDDVMQAQWHERRQRCESAMARTIMATMIQAPCKRSEKCYNDSADPDRRRATATVPIQMLQQHQRW
jgi:hypothetical protein